MQSTHAVADSINQNIGGWEPENAADLDTFLGDLPEVFNALSESIKCMAATLSDRFPVDPVVVDRLRDISATVGGMSEYAGEARTAHRSAHERELERIENPRTNERFWDVSEQ